MPNTREKLIELLTQVAVLGDYLDMRKVADHLIANGVTIQKWIPVTERLPEIVAPYLVLSRAGNCSVQWFHIHGENFKGFFYAEEPGKITHWMPLPEPPKEA